MYDGEVLYPRKSADVIAAVENSVSDDRQRVKFEVTIKYQIFEKERAPVKKNVVRLAIFPHRTNWSDCMDSGKLLHSYQFQTGDPHHY